MFLEGCSLRIALSGRGLYPITLARPTSARFTASASYRLGRYASPGNTAYCCAKFARFLQQRSWPSLILISALTLSCPGWLIKHRRCDREPNFKFQTLSISELQDRTGQMDKQQGCGVLDFCGTPIPTLGLIVWHNDCVLKDDLIKILNSFNKRCTTVYRVLLVK